MDVDDVVIVQDPPKKLLTIVITQIDANHWCLHLFGDVCIHPDGLSQSQSSDTGGESSCPGKEFHGKKLR